MQRVRRARPPVMATSIVTVALTLVAVGPASASAVREAESPAVQQLATDAVVRDCGISRQRARLLLRVQDESQHAVSQLSRRDGVVDIYYRSCRPGLVVQTLPGVRRAPLRRIVRRADVSRWTTFVTVRHTRRELGRAQRAIERQLDDLLQRCLLTSGATPSTTPLASSCPRTPPTRTSLGSSRRSPPRRCR